MPTHPPKHISSMEGLGLNTTKQTKFIDENKAVGTEVWDELEKPWTESGGLVGVYCGICSPVERVEGGFTFDDMYLMFGWFLVKSL